MPTNVQPFEIIVAPFSAYWAPTGEAFPLIDAAPAGNWQLIGKSGDRNYSEDGVTVSHSQTVELIRTLGSTGPRKASRTEEILSIAFTLFDMTLEQYRLAINLNAVAVTAAGGGTAGFKTLQLYRGVSVATHALLLRGTASPEGDGWNSQYEVPYCFHAGSPEPVFRKGQPAGLALGFTTIEDPNAASAAERFGQLIVQHQDPI